MDDFQNMMKGFLKDRYDEYISLFDREPYRGIRINTLKTTTEKIKELLPFIDEKVPFYDNGYYVSQNDDKLGNNPLYIAGAIYSQEPSAMSAVPFLEIEKGDAVLDLCAAPGSKSTQIAEILDGTGLLWANEIVKSRANILLSNIERMGIKNAIVSNSSPELLSEKFKSRFDKILVDAPCSGEGMFRKDKNARNEWSIEHVHSCAQRQLKILESAKSMLKDGGTLVYSTCTFNTFENEGVIEKFLNNNPEFSLVDTRRIFPFDGGEGHFAAKLKKSGIKNKTEFFSEQSNDKNINDFLDCILKENNFKNIEVIGSSIYALPYSRNSMPDMNKINILRAGIKLAEIGKNIILPHHNLFTCCKMDEYINSINFKIDDEKLIKYLHGEEIDIKDLKGYTAVCVEDIPLGFGKAVSTKLKNKFPKGLRVNG